MSGLTYLLQESAWIFLLVKICGAMYLISIGLRQIYQSFKPDADAVKAKSGMLTNDGRFALFRQGALIALSNPKAILFLSAVFPQFLTMENIQWSQFLILLSTFVFCCLLSHTLYMWLTLNLGKRLLGQVWANRVKQFLGLLFIVIGISMLGVNAGITT
jgi:threonine/homoserine/homoserine lactone efflux protein